MPELPEVEFARGCLERWLVGEVVDVSAPRTRLLRGSSVEAFESLSGRRLEKVDRKGKWLLLSFEGGGGCLVHLGMTGKLVRASPGLEVRWSRARFRGRHGVEVHLRDPRMFGRLVPGMTASLEKLPEVSALGPDAWTTSVDGRRLRTLAAGRRRAIKDVLLDQSVLAGLGNIQATEALFRARLHPSIRADRLTDAEYSRLSKAIRWSLSRTLRMNQGDEIEYVEEKGAPNPFVVYGRAKSPCPNCRQPLRSIVIGGRASVYCARCQPARR